MSRPHDLIENILSTDLDRSARSMYQLHGPRSAALHARLCLQYGRIQRIKKESAERRVAELERQLEQTQTQLAETQDELVATQEALGLLTDEWERGELIFWGGENGGQSSTPGAISAPHCTAPASPPQVAAPQDLHLIERSNEELVDPSPPGSAAGASSPVHMQFGGHAATDLLGVALEKPFGGWDGTSDEKQAGPALDDDGEWTVVSYKKNGKKINGGKRGGQGGRSGSK